MAFWKKKGKDESQKCPLCATPVSQDDDVCPLCFYELKLSPRHQALNITENEEETLIGLLNSEIEPEEDDEVLEVEDVINLNASEVTIEAQYDSDDLMNVPSEYAPEFITQRMTPKGVAENNTETINDTGENNIDSEDLIDTSFLTPNEVKNQNISPPSLELPTPPVPVELPPPPKLPSLPIPPELPPPPKLPSPPKPPELPPPPKLPSPPIPPELPPPPKLPSPSILREDTSPYDITNNMDKLEVSPANEKELTNGPVWPWASKEEWDSQSLSKELLEAINAAKNNNNQHVERILEKIGPHLGNNINLIFHVGLLLKKIGRNYELIEMLTRARIQFPGNKDVENAFSKLT